MACMPFSGSGVIFAMQDGCGFLARLLALVSISFTTYQLPELNAAIYLYSFSDYFDGSNAGPGLSFLYSLNQGSFSPFPIQP